MNNVFMQAAINEAKKAFKKGEVPIGAVIVKNNKIIAKAHNLVEIKNNALCHAEIIAIKKASKKLKNWRLSDCDLYVTLEPCDMCTGAIKNARINKVYYATKKNQENSKKQDDYVCLNNYTVQCLELIQTFFKNRRG
ncbi:MAG: nucleoside deaminase [Bacilli bacterium]|nr:nucleoside deaminase [Bacilli bacterium]